MQLKVKTTKNEGGRHHIIIDIMVISFGLLISSFGTAIFYQSGMGSGAMATFSDGLHKLLDISYGMANMMANMLFLILLFVCDRKMINIGTVLCVFLIGIFVDIGTFLFTPLSIASAPEWCRFLCMLLGCVMMGTGLGLYVAVDRGFGALEGLVKYVCKKKNLSFDKVKIIQDFLLIGIGIALRAEWGIGTVISAILIGPIMRVSIGYFQSVFYKNQNISPTGADIKI
mgnify:CR=1 FL=1